MGTPTKNIAMLAKLVLLAAVLSAVALASPISPDTVVPEEMVQTTMSSASAEQVADLQTQFADLKNKIQSGDVKTAQVMKTISKMIDLVDNEIVGAINNAHKFDQKKIKDTHQVIVDYNTDFGGTRQTLDNKLKGIQTDIKNHNIAAQIWSNAANAYKTAIAKYEKDVSDKTDTCCDKQQAEKEATEYTPAYATCDYTSKEATKCTDVAKANAATAVQTDFENGLKRYLALKKGCTDMTTLVAKDLADYNKKNDHCDDSQASCITKQDNIATKKTAFDSDWSTASSTYATGIAKREGDYTTLVTKTKALEFDRKNEWQSTQEIGCMLENYVAGGHGSFAAAAMDVCKGKIKKAHLVITYPAIPARVKWPAYKYNDMTSTKEFAEDCQLEENAKEDADTKCNFVSEAKYPDAECTCKGKDCEDGPVWTLSTAGAGFASE